MQEPSDVPTHGHRDLSKAFQNHRAYPNDWTHYQTILKALSQAMLDHAQDLETTYQAATSAGHEATIETEHAIRIIYNLRGCADFSREVLNITISKEVWQQRAPELDASSPAACKRTKHEAFVVGMLLIFYAWFVDDLELGRWNIIQRYAVLCCFLLLLSLLAWYQP